MSNRLDCFVDGRDPTTEAEPAAEVGADGAGRQRVSGTVESIRYRGATVRCDVDVGGELFVERAVGAAERFVEPTVGAAERFDEGRSVELSRDRDDVLACEPAGNTAWC